MTSMDECMPLMNKYFGGQINRRLFTKTLLSSSASTIVSTSALFNFLMPKIMSDQHTFQIGAFTCTLFKDLLFHYQAQHYFLDVPEEETAVALQPYSHTPDDISSPFVALLLERENEKILIDTGVGYMEEPIEFQGQPMKFQGTLPSLLHQRGIDPASITHVVMTHFHPDHIGGVCHPDKSPAFPNASYLGHQAEWDFWMSDQVANLPPIFNFFIEYNIHPLKNANLKLISQKEVDIIPGVTAIQVPGHTPGQFAVRIESESEKLLFISDVWLHPLHIEHLDWRTSYDLDHDLARRSRVEMLQLAHSEDMLVQSFHFPFPGLGKVEKRGDGWRWVDF